ncbi:hypothetical protein [Lapidilactobacillus luobeiensis]|uniref:hypothetical protein n=1 Tax=Lapidilactobacillus luobeiensis TaxID=2950371 RepID=UPI0021C2A00D|nr:hypothetical protein [Lapidilactobacillus luobeiensis]
MAIEQRKQRIFYGRWWQGSHQAAQAGELRNEIVKFLAQYPDLTQFVGIAFQDIPDGFRYFIGSENLGIGEAFTLIADNYWIESVKQGDVAPVYQQIQQTFATKDLPVIVEPLANSTASLPIKIEHYQVDPDQDFRIVQVEIPIDPRP